MFLNFITHSRNPDDSASHLDQISQTLAGGCRMIQLRMKDSPRELLYDTVVKALSLLASYPAARLIIDDDIRTAIAAGAHGVHLGLDDMPVSEARAISPEGFIIGATANTLDRLVDAARQGADYIGLGPLRFTTTKQKLSPVLGYEGYRSIISGAKSLGIDIPVLAIGSVGIDDIIPLHDAGVAGIAVSGNIINSTDSVKTTEQYINTLKQYT